MHAAHDKKPTAQLLFPHPSLSGLIFMAVERDTRGCHLGDAQRFNYYPASPFPTISWVFDGTLHMVQNGGETQKPELSAPLPCLIFAGPQDRPSASWSPTSIHALTVSFYPEALGELLDMPIASHINQVCPLETITSNLWLHVLSQLLSGSETIELNPFNRLQDMLLNELTHSKQLKTLQPSIHNWLKNLHTQAAFSPSGYSLRQIQRRIKQWTGQNHKELQLYARTERIFQNVSKAESPTNWSTLSVDSGCADQSHMGRQVRRVTGHSPQKLQQLIMSEEGFWLYRLLEQHHREEPQNS